LDALRKRLFFHQKEMFGYQACPVQNKAKAKAKKKRIRDYFPSQPTFQSFVTRISPLALRNDMKFNYFQIRLQPCYPATLQP